MLNALILGLIQGLSEFLPISSSGHVKTAEILLGLKDDSGFAAAIHLATCIAAIIYFRKDIWGIIKGLLDFKTKSRERDLGINIIIATIPAVIFGFIVTKIGLDEYFSTPMAIGVSAIVFGMLLYFAERYSNKLHAVIPTDVGIQEQSDESVQKSKINVDRSLDSRSHGNDNSSRRSSIFNSVIIGSAQLIAAIFPGASRSGITLTTAFFLKMKKEDAAKFVFLISIPITALASINEIALKKSVHLDADFFIALVSAFISGLFAIKFLLYFIQKAKLKWLVLYRIIFGLVAILVGIV